MAGRRDDPAGHAGQASGLSGWTRRGALGAGLAQGAVEPPRDVPIRFAGNIPWTPVWLNGKGPFPFRIRSDSNTFRVNEDFAKDVGLEQQAGEWGMRGGAQHRRIIRFYKAREMIVGGQVPIANMRLAGVDDVDRRKIDDEPVGPTDPFVGSIPVPSDRVTSFQWSQGLMRYSPALPADIDLYGKVPLRHFETYFGWLALVECRFAGKPVRLTISTASPQAIAFNPDAAKRLGSGTPPVPSTRGGAAMSARTWRFASGGAATSSWAACASNSR